MGIKVNIDVPKKDHGFWLVTNFLECFKHSDHHIWVNIEIVNVTYDTVLEKYMFGDRIAKPYPLQYMMYVTIGDEFDLTGSPIKKRYLKTLDWEIVTKPEKLEIKAYHHQDFLQYSDRFPLNSSSDGMLYFDVFDYDKNDREKLAARKSVVIIPASVIGQFFYFLESDFANLLYSINLKYILKDYNRENIEHQDGLKIGKFFYQWEYCKNDNVLAAISNFLFSKNDHLIKALYSIFNKNLKAVYHSPAKIPFYYKIPVDAEIKLKIRGNYFKDSDDKGVFLVKEIIDFETKGIPLKKLFTVDKIEYQPDIAHSLSGVGNPEDAQGGTGVRRPKGKDSTEISGSSPSNSSFQPRNIKQEIKRFGNIVPVEKSINKKYTVQLITDIFTIGDETSEGDTLHPENEEKDGNKRGIKTSTGSSENGEKTTRDQEKTKTYLKEVINVFINNYSDDFEVFSFDYKLNDHTIIDFVEITRKDSDRFVYFIDAFGQRIQVVYNTSLSRYSEKVLKNVIDSIRKHNFNSWQPWRKSNYAFDAMEFGVSINRGVDNYVNDDFYKKESVKFLERVASIIN